MYTIEMLPAAQGDCLWIEYGDPAGQLHRILIDGGTVGTIDEIEAKINAVAQAEGRCHLELVVVTHVDGDHIEGIIKLLGKPSLPVDIGEVWFNGHRHLPDPDGSDSDDFLGAKQGDFLSVLLDLRKVPWNADPWEGGTVYVPPAERDALPRRTLPGGMELTLLSPDYDMLKNLSKRWVRELEKAGVADWTDEEQLEALMASRTLAPEDEDEFLSGEDGAPGDIDVAKLIASREKSDHSPANGSSIAFIAAYDGASCLLAGDAYSDVLEASIDRLAVETGVARVAVDAFKTPHHASKNNVHQGLLHKIDCHDFLISTSGARFKHPDEQAIARIVAGAWRADPKADEPVRLFFNYDSPFSRVWRDPDLVAEWNYEPIYPPISTAAEGQQPGLTVTLAP